MSGKGGDSSGGNEFIAIITIVMAVVMLYFVDLMYGAHLRKVMLYIYGVELWIANTITRFIGYDYSAVVGYAFGTPGAQVYWSDVLAVGGASNFWWRWLVIPGILGVGYYVYKRMPGANYDGKMGFEQFISYQARYWKYIAPWVSFNPEKSKNPNDAPALSPQAYAKLAERDGEIDEALLRTMLSKQLKTTWTNAASLPHYMQILFAMFAFKCADNADWDPKHKDPDSRKMIREEVRKMQFDVWESFDPTKPSIGNEKTAQWVEKIFSNAKIMSRVSVISRGHAYAETVLLSLLEFARLRGGVMAPAEFRWLKSIDRSLWYALDDARPPKDNLAPFPGTFHAEGSGIMAHWLAEKTYRAAINEPFVDSAHISIIRWTREHG